MLCLVSISVPLWLKDNCSAKPITISINEFVALIPNWEVGHCRSNNIVGDGGRAYGCYQIHNIMVEDYNRIKGTNAKHEDTFDNEFSKKIAYEVLLHYSKHIESLGIQVTSDHLLFIWNGGGGAWRRVHLPIDDQKQKNLIRYRNRATPIILDYINEQKKRREPSQRA